MTYLVEAIDRWAADLPDKSAIVYLHRGERAGDEISFRRLRQRALAVANALRAMGLEGQSALLVFPSGIDFVVGLLGCLYARVIAVPAPYLLPRRAAERITAIQQDAGCRAVLTVSALANDDAVADAGLRGLPRILVDTIDEAAHMPSPAGPQPDTVAFLQYTSGSVGNPKGVIVTADNLRANQAMIAAAFRHDRETPAVNWLPMFHDMGLIGGVLQPLYLGATVVLMSPLAFLQKPVRWLKAISTFRGTTSGAPCFAYGLVTKSVRREEIETLDLRSWSLAFCGSEPIRPEELSTFAATFAGTGFRPESLYPCYGLAEATLYVAGGPRDRGIVTAPAAQRGGPHANVGAATMAASGEAPPGQIAIVDRDTGRRTPPGVAGEVWIRGPHVAAGYWRRPEASAEVFAAELEDGTRPYLRTGDAGMVRDGQLFIIGRFKDVLIVRGAKHHPEEIEASVAAAHSALAGGTGAVFAVDEEGCEATIVLQELDRHAALRPDLEQAARAAFDAVVAFHGIRADRLLLLRPGALARTTSGKVQRHRCREDFEAGRMNDFVICRFDAAAPAGLADV